VLGKQFRDTPTSQDIPLEDIDVTPDKRILESIAADIDLKRGVLELIDNAIDEWKRRGKPNLKVEIGLDVVNQLLSYEDDAGGIKEENLNMIMQPGGTTRTPDESSIGRFGLGLKRGIVALSRNAEVVTRFESMDTFKIKIDDLWIKGKSWKIRKYKTAPIQGGSTVINITQVKFDITVEAVSEIRQLLSETYGLLLSNYFTIWLNGELIEPIEFNNWAYPPYGRYPRDYRFFIGIQKRRVYVNATIGLMPISSQTGDYGFYVYCNDRLILSHYKDPEIGFTAGLLGYPHPEKAWFRCVIRITGANQDMPWNSTKSGLEWSNPIVSRLKSNLLRLSKPYVQLSARLSRDAEAQIGAYPAGKIETVDLTSREDFVLDQTQTPSLPQARRSEAEKLLNLNKDAIKERPWTRALVENVYVADLILGKKLENKNRFALILLDSCLEIAFRDYLLRVVKGVKFTRDQRKELSRREVLIEMMKKHSQLPADIWDSLNYFYELRCSLYHELASPEVTDSDIETFRDLVSVILFTLHQLAV